MCIHVVRIALVGSHKTGKSSFLWKLAGKNLKLLESTIGIDHIHLRKNPCLRVVFMDCCDDQKYDHIIKGTCDIADIVLLFCDNRKASTRYGRIVNPDPHKTVVICNEHDPNMDYTHVTEFSKAHKLPHYKISAIKTSKEKLWALTDVLIRKALDGKKHCGALHAF